MIENVAAVPVFVAKPRAKFVTVQKLDKPLLFKLVRAMEFPAGRGLYLCWELGELWR